MLLNCVWQRGSFISHACSMLASVWHLGSLTSHACSMHVSFRDSCGSNHEITFPLRWTVVDGCGQIAKVAKQQIDLCTKHLKHSAQLLSNNFVKVDGTVEDFIETQNNVLVIAFHIQVLLGNRISKSDFPKLGSLFGTSSFVFTYTKKNSISDQKRIFFFC